MAVRPAPVDFASAMDVLEMCPLGTEFQAAKFAQQLVATFCVSTRRADDMRAQRQLAEAALRSPQQPRTRPVVLRV